MKNLFLLVALCCGTASAQGISYDTYKLLSSKLSECVALQSWRGIKAEEDLQGQERANYQSLAKALAEKKITQVQANEVSRFIMQATVASRLINLAQAAKDDLEAVRKAVIDGTVGDGKTTPEMEIIVHRVNVCMPGMMEVTTLLKDMK
jgi:putative component of toxin-antitoxin plasmid stabilization module